eukprot:Sspe_Gene.6548::Locus_2206_Transcript_1_2_Confidence_0.667_Length_1795::g.6548::m.6548
MAARSVSRAALAPAHAPLPKGDFTVLTYNVLLPNSQDGWWVRKAYRPDVPEEHRVWSHRQELLKEQILRAEADVVCVQEASPKSFKEDFAFMEEAGYACVLHDKTRFACATFYAKERLVLVKKVLGRERVIITEFQTDEGRTFCVVNVHLTAGNGNGGRRLRQVAEALDLLKKQTKGREVPETVVCGDFNSAGDTAVRQLLLHGDVKGGFTEPGGEVVTNKGKKQSVGRFRDVFEEVAVPTLLVP